MAKELKANKKRVFRNTQEFEEHFFPNYCKMYPYMMRLSEEERNYILFRRGMNAHSKVKKE